MILGMHVLCAVGKNPAICRYVFCSPAVYLPVWVTKESRNLPTYPQGPTTE